MKIWAKVVMLVSILAVMTGCSSFSISDMGTTERVLAETTVVSATMRYIEEAEDQAERAEGVMSVVEDFETFAGNQEVFTLDEAETFVRGEIPWHDMKQSEVVLANGLLVALRMEIEKRVEDGEVDPKTFVDVQEVLSWVEQGAVVYLDGGE